jgi:hypothetical protein
LEAEAGEDPKVSDSGKKRKKKAKKEANKKQKCEDVEEVDGSLAASSGRHLCFVLTKCDS